MLNTKQALFHTYLFNFSTYHFNQKDPELIDSYSDDFTYISHTFSGNFKRTIKADHIGSTVLLLSFD